MVIYFQSFLESNKATKTSGVTEEEIFNLETNDSCGLSLLKEILKFFKEYEKYQKEILKYMVKLQ